MKTARDPRHKKRLETVKDLFAFSFHDQKVGGQAQKIMKLAPELDKEIEGAADSWSIDRFNKIDLSILRLAVYEMFHTDTPPKVTIDEAIEIAKLYGGESSPSFVNGILGNILSKHDELKKR